MEKRNNSGFLQGFLRVVCASALVLGVADQAAAQTTRSIKDSKHNLGTTGTHTNKLSAGTSEICVFCHTPHGGAQTTAPLWNKSHPSASYTTYTSSTMDAATANIGSVSLACLSCHDGTQAMDSMINAPGSGLDKTGTWTWSAPSGGKLTEGIAALGTDLSNDHPIGIAYCGGGVTASAPDGACKDKDFNKPQHNAGTFWLDTAGGTAATREKSDIVLYTRDLGGTQTPSVECASCHDPHQANTATFLRVENTGSQVCLACHNK